MSGLVFFAVLIVIVSARPNADIGAQNVVTVPPNCPAGQQWINGQCRDIWRQSQHEPPNCPAGQQWINVKCRDVWRQNQHHPKNIVVVLLNCPSGQQWINGACRDVWRQSQHDLNNGIVEPPNCPSGQQWINGQCRDAWRGFEPKNTMTMSPKCPNGQDYVNGQCRDIISGQDIIDPTVMLVPPNCQDSKEYINGKCWDSWIERNTVDAGFKNISSKNWFLIWFETLKSHRVIRSADEGKAGIMNRSIFDIPKHCPKGQSADSMGYCRPVFDQRK